MQLPELQQYAALHKNDPYIVTLALSIANQKKQMMASKDGQAGMQPQPKVVDQDIAQMVPHPVMAPRSAMAAAPQQQALPEDQGIGQLPAQNMQNMAGGGIVAFANEGFVDPAFTGEEQDSSVLGRFFAQTPEQKRQAAVQNAIMRKKTDVTNQRGILGLKKQNPAEKQAYERTQAEIAYLEKLKNNPNYVPPPGNILLNTEADPSTTLPANTPFNPPGMPPAQTGTATVPASDAGAPAAAPSYEDAYTAGIDKLLKASQTSSGAPAKIDATKYAVTAPQLANATPEEMASRLAAAMGPNPTESPLAGQQTELNKANIASRQKYADDLEKQFKEQGLAFTDTLNKLTSKEARVKTMEDNQLGMSMFEAGLAMMAGDSPYAMVNIGKGAQVGTKKYMEIQEKVEGARDKIDDAKMKIEEFRRNEANMNAREQRLARKDVNDTVSAGAQASLNLMREQYGLKHAEGLAFVNNSYMLERFNAEQKTSVAIHNQSTAAGLDTAYAKMANERQIAGSQNALHLGLAALQAKMPPAEARTAMMLGTGATNAERLESGMRKLSEIQSDKSGMAAIKLLTEENKARAMQAQPPLTMEDLLKSVREYNTLMYPKVVTDPGAKAPVYGRP